MKGFTFTIQCMITFFKLSERLQKHFSKSLKTETGFITRAIICQRILLESGDFFNEQKLIIWRKCRDS